ncbi:recombinase family protein [Yoonia sp.]|uniref:recombinase family protein n=1 Tax=Yoonia sp. TaxID=2212373 RepID=UPI003A4E66F0
MKQFVIYTRVSTRRQGDSGLGLDAQHRDVELYLSTYAEVPFEVLGKFQDIESGANGERPELWKAIELAEKTGATLLVAKLDRLSRKVSFISAVMDRKKLNLTVASMPHADKFQLHIYAALAEQEREFISLRTKAALAPLRGTGKLGGNRGNIDKANEASRAIANTHAHKVIDTVLPLKEAGRTLQQIADTLNKTGVTTARGGKWYPTTVKNVLSRI